MREKMQALAFHAWLVHLFIIHKAYSGNVCGYPGYGGVHICSLISWGNYAVGECLNKDVRDQLKQHSETQSQIWVKNQDCHGLSQS